MNDKKIKLVEGNVVFSLFSDLDKLYDIKDSINPDTMFTLPESRYYYSLALGLYNSKYKKVDNVAIETFLSDKPKTKEVFDEYGGYETIREMCDIVDTSNFDVYFDKLKKYFLVRNLKKKGFSFDNIDIESLNSTEIYDIFDYILNETYLDVGMDSDIVELEMGDDYFQELVEGKGLGVSIATRLPRLNYELSGLRKKEVGLLSALSGAGKSSMLVECFILPLVEQGIKVGMISNEMVINKIKDMILVSILTSQFKYFKINRKKLKTGNFTVEDKNMLKKAMEYNNKNIKPYLQFVELYTYDTGITNKIMKKMARSGVEFICYDVLKPSNFADARYYGEMVEVSKNMSEQAKKLDIGVILTQQIANHSINVRYLNRSCLSASKQVVEIVDFHIMLRTVWDDEYGGENNDLEVFNFQKDKEGNYIREEGKSIKEIVSLDRDKRNLVMFLDKNRNGKEEVCYSLVHNGDFNRFYELGYCTPSHVNR